MVHWELKPDNGVLLNTCTFFMENVCLLLALEDWVLGQMLSEWKDTEAG